MCRTKDQAAPTVNYYYDNVTNAKGKLTKVASSVSTTEYTSFDILGRVTGHKQTTDGGASAGYTTLYTYNLAGALIDQTYPSGRVVKNVLDVNGDLSMVQSKENANAGYWSYANSFSYNAAGAVTSMQLGNGRWEKTVFNSRLQPTQIALGVTAGATDLLKLDYSYGTTANNGNILSQTITVPTVGTSTGFTAVQNYTYDSLNRLESADEKPYGWSACTSDPTKCWKQTFVYDRYGNRRFDEANTTMPTSFANPAISNPTISTSNNRLTSTGWTYDAAGNTLTDAQGRSFTYDGENKQVLVKTGSITNGKYWYDGDGKRVKKEGYDSAGNLTELTIFVYDAAGKLIAEYSPEIVAVEDAKVAYLTNDHLGSPRINTDRDGNVTSRHDYHPFGEEILTSARASHNQYVADSVKKQFTGYERDNESGLDFAEARMYSTGLGRFTSVDPLMASATVSEPQSWNRYTYVGNNPLRYIDVTGKDYDDLTGKRKKIIDDYYADRAKKEKKSVKEIYDGLTSDKKLHYEGITNALEKTKLFDKNGKATGKTALDYVKSIDVTKLGADGKPDGIRGFDGDYRGNQSFRIFVEYEIGAIAAFSESKSNFKGSGASEHAGMFASFRENGDPSIQIVYEKSGTRGEVDIDFDHGGMGVLDYLLPGGSRGVKDVRNSDIDFNNGKHQHRKEYERRYGQIPRKQ